jgi:hypothetical protein
MGTTHKMHQPLNKLKSFVGRKVYVVAAVVMSIASFAPALLASQPAQAAVLTSRSLSLSNNRNTGTATYTFTVTTSATTGGVEFAFCTTPLVSSTCTSPTGLTVAGTSVTSSPAGFAVSTAGNAPACSIATAVAPASANTLSGSGNSACAIRAQHATTVAAGATTFTVSSVGNPTTAGTFFVRIATYSSNTFGTFQDAGTVANSVQAATNVSFKVQEILTICTGATTIDVPFATTPIGTAATCDNSGITGYLAAVDLGVADPTVVRVTPVASGGTTLGNATNGFALVKTNAANSTIQYRTVADATGTASGELKVPGATCTVTALRSTVSTDQCINSTPLTQTNGSSEIVAGTEEFGVTVPFLNKRTGSTTSNLVRDTNYDGDGTTGGTCTPATPNTPCWAWADTATAATLATGTGPLDSEAVILKFAAASAYGTPTGAYSVNMSIFAVPVY